MSAPGPARRAADGGKNDWRTPPDLFTALNERDGEFTIDGAASAENALCPDFYDEQMDAFRQAPWGENIFVNPPYGKLGPWVNLFIKWAKAGNYVTALVPAATDTIWFAKLAKNADITFLTPGRVSFIDPATAKPVAGNTTGSVVANLYPYRKHHFEVDFWDWR